MAQYNDLIADLAIGSYGNGNGTITGWTQSWAKTNAFRQYSVNADAAAPSGKSLKVNHTTNTRTLLQNDAISADAGRDNLKVLMLVRSNRAASGTTASIDGGILAYGGGSASSETGLVAAAGDNTSTQRSINIQEYASGSTTAKDVIGAPAPTIYWLELAINAGAYTVTAWNETELDGAPIATSTGTTSISNANNYVGIFSFVSGCDFDVLWYSAGTAGDSAPRPVVDAPINFTGTIPAQNFTGGASVDVDLSTYFTGSFTPFTFANTGGSTSATGLSVNSAGHLVGTATEGSATAVIVTGTDDEANTDDSNTFNITVVPAGVETTLVTAIDGSNISSTLSSITDATTSTPTVTAARRPDTDWTTALSNGFMFAVEGVEGKTPAFRFNSSDLRYVPLTEWRPLWTTDFVTYTRAPSRTISGGFVTFQFTDPLPAGRVYITTHPMMRAVDWQEYAADLLANYPSIAAPTASAAAYKVANPAAPDGAYAITPTESDENSRAIGANYQYAIKLAFGGSTTDGGPKRKWLMSFGVHAMGEATASHMGYKCLQWILDDTSAEAVRIRSNFDIYVYGLINPNGTYGGYRRSTARFPTSDPNRQFELTTPDWVEIANYKAAATSDLAGSVDVAISWHTWAERSGYTFIPYTWVQAKAADVIAIGATVFGNLDPDYDDQVEDRTEYVWAYEQLGAQAAFAAEIGQRTTSDPQYFTDVGVNWGKTISAADADGMFYEAPTSALISAGLPVPIAEAAAESSAPPSVGSVISAGLPMPTASVIAVNAGNNNVSSISAGLPVPVASVAAESSAPVISVVITSGLPVPSASVTATPEQVNSAAINSGLPLPAGSAAAVVSLPIYQAAISAGLPVPTAIIAASTGERQIFISADRLAIIPSMSRSVAF